MVSRALALAIVLSACTPHRQRVAGVATMSVGGVVLGGAVISKSIGETQEPYEVMGMGFAIAVAGLVILLTAPGDPAPPTQSAQIQQQ